LIVINNALYLSGQEYYKELEELGSDGHLALEEIIPVPTDITGDENTRQGKPPVDPAPFNHSTKIAILRVHRKDRLTSRDIPPPTIRG
jgi:23S rRNA (cytosine1962-C5)-methyltransferase